MRAGVQSVYQTFAARFVDKLFGQGGRFQVDDNVWLGGCQFGLDVGGKLVEFHAQCFLVSHWHCGYSSGFACDGVAQIAPVERCECQIGFVRGLPQKTCQQFVGVAAPFLDVVAAVAAGQPFYRDAKTEIACGCWRWRIV